MAFESLNTTEPSLVSIRSMVQSGTTGEIEEPPGTRAIDPEREHPSPMVLAHEEASTKRWIPTPRVVDDHGGGRSVGAVVEQR